MADLNELYVNNPALCNEKEECSADKSSRNIKRDVSKALERRKTENLYDMTCIRSHRKSLSCQPVSGKEYDPEQSIGIDVKCPRSRNPRKKCKMVAYSHGNRSRNIKGLKMRCRTVSSKDYKCVANFALGESEYNVDSGSRDKSEFELNCEVNWAGFLAGLDCASLPALYHINPDNIATTVINCTDINRKRNKKHCTIRHDDEGFGLAEISYFDMKCINERPYKPHCYGNISFVNTEVEEESIADTVPRFTTLYPTVKEANLGTEKILSPKSSITVTEPFKEEIRFNTENTFNTTSSSTADSSTTDKMSYENQIVSHTIIPPISSLSTITRIEPETRNISNSTTIESPPQRSHVHISTLIIVGTYILPVLGILLIFFIVLRYFRRRQTIRRSEKKTNERNE